MNITFISKEKLKNKTPYILAGTIALASVFGLTGCTEGHVMEGSDLEDILVLRTENGNLLVDEMYVDYCKAEHYKDKISDNIYCTSKGKNCEFTNYALFIDENSIISKEPIYFYLTEDEIVKKDFLDEEIVKIYKRINE